MQNWKVCRIYNHKRKDEKSKEFFKNDKEGRDRI
jgi:hypothetical protein